MLTFQSIEDCLQELNLDVVSPHCIHPPWFLCLLETVLKGCSLFFRCHKTSQVQWPLKQMNVIRISHLQNLQCYNSISFRWIKFFSRVIVRMDSLPSKLVLYSASKKSLSHIGSLYLKSTTDSFFRKYFTLRATFWIAKATAQMPSYVYPWNREYS